MKAKLIIADDHEILRAGLRALLDDHGMEVVGEADNGRKAVALARELQPDVVLMDIDMPGLNGVEATRQITTELDGTRVLGMSTQCEMRAVSRMLDSGAAGFLVKDCDGTELRAALEAIASGGAYLSPRVAGVLVNGARASVPPGVATTASLTPREREVLQLLSEGRSTKQIAAELGLSEKTVENHRRQTREKLGLHTTAELTKFAVREGLTRVDY